MIKRERSFRHIGTFNIYATLTVVDTPSDRANQIVHPRSNVEKVPIVSTANMLLSAAGFLPILSVLIVKTADGLQEIDDIMYNEYKEYVLLVSDIQEHHKASSVIIVHPGNDESNNSNY